MTSQSTSHLTEDELDEAMMGAASVDRLAHLKSCSICNAHFEAFQSTMAAFNHASSAWSEAKSHALSRDLRQHHTPFRVTSRLVWSCASAVALAVSILGLGLQQRSQQVAASYAKLHDEQLEKVHSEEALSDDAMLRQIDAAINTAVPSPEEVYGIANAISSEHSTARRAQVKN